MSDHKKSADAGSRPPDGGAAADAAAAVASAAAEQQLTSDKASGKELENIDAGHADAHKLTDKAAGKQVEINRAGDDDDKLASEISTLNLAGTATADNAAADAAGGNVLTDRNQQQRDQGKVKAPAPLLPVSVTVPVPVQGDAPVAAAEKPKEQDPAAVGSSSSAKPEEEDVDPVDDDEKMALMHEALEMARLALKTNETPVGCVLVYKGRIIAKGMNATNDSRNGTRHAELMAISALTSHVPRPAGKDADNPVSDDVSTWPDVDPEGGHLFPYGQKLHPAAHVDQSIIRECVLYVTVEPCIMCASLLRQLGIKKVYFGAVNDKFGGTGGVFRIHKNSNPNAPAYPAPEMRNGLAVRPAMQKKAAGGGSVSRASDAAAAATIDSPTNPADEDDTTSSAEQKSGGKKVLSRMIIPDDGQDGDGGNVECGFQVEGGWGRDEAVTLLRQFYVQENGRAPIPRKKDGRAARLAAMMEQEGHGGGSMAEFKSRNLESGSASGDDTLSGDDDDDESFTNAPDSAATSKAKEASKSLSV